MRKVEATINIRSSPEMVIQAFVEQEMLKAWWGVERSLIAKRIGGTYTLAWRIDDNGFGFVSTGVIGDLDPSRQLIVDEFVYLNPARPILGPMRLTVRALRNGDETTVLLVQEGYQEGDDWDWYYDSVRVAWPMALAELKMYLEKR